MKIISKFVLTLAAVAALSWATPSFANLVQNGGFETGDFTDWALAGNTGFTFVDGNPHSGAHAAWLGPIGSDGTMTQNLATTAGNSYSLTYWLANLGGPSNDFSVYWNGSLIAASAIVDSGPFGYTEYRFNDLLATTGSTPLEFVFRQDPSYFNLDNVSVPDGGTTLCLFGLAIVGVCLIRRWAPASVK